MRSTRSRLTLATLAMVLAGGSAAYAQYYSPRYGAAPPLDGYDDGLGDDGSPDYAYPGTLPRRGAGARRVGRLADPAALPADADPAYSTPGGSDADVDLGTTTRREVVDPTGQAAGTLTVNTARRKLYLSLGDGRALEYGIGVGRQGFAWKGQAEVGRKAYWPGWTPPKEMVARRPDLPAHMDGGLENPLGARALYLFQGGKDTLFRIHGTNEPETIGRAVSSGCIRMLNADVIDLYGRVSKGAHVVVL